MSVGAGGSVVVVVVVVVVDEVVVVIAVTVATTIGGSRGRRLRRRAPSIAAPIDGPTTATSTVAASGEVLMSVMLPVIATPEPSAIVVPAASTAPAVTTTNADTSALTMSASLVLNTSRTRSTSRVPAPGVNVPSPAPGAIATPMIVPPSGDAATTSKPTSGSATMASPTARRAPPLPPPDGVATAAAGPSATTKVTGSAVIGVGWVSVMGSVASSQENSPSPKPTRLWAITSECPPGGTGPADAMATCRTGTPAAAKPTAASRIGVRSARQRMNVTVNSSVCPSRRQGDGGRREATA